MIDVVGWDNCSYFTLREKSLEKSCESETSLLKVANCELIEIARKDEPSVLRNTSYNGMCKDHWMD